jgi:apolipoprotein D and lipocalin family protein
MLMELLEHGKQSMKLLNKSLLLLVILFLTACVGKPDGIQPITGFEVNRYLGTWYEIARLDHSFERGLTAVTANYSFRDDGGIKVINKGYDLDKQRWKSAEGKAYFVEDDRTGFLKVSFFGPFYGSYIIMELDKENYQYALVCGPNKDFLWVLARTPDVDSAIVQRLVQKATDLGFDTENLIYVEHTEKDAE